MALKPVTDPNVLNALRQPVSDPAILAQLNAPEAPPAAPAAPVAETPPGGYSQPYSYFTPEVQRNVGNTGENAEQFIGTGETALSTASAAGGSIAGGLAGLGNLAFNYSLPGLVAHKLGVPEAESADVVQAVQNALRYNPRTESGQIGAQAVSDAFDPEVGSSKLNVLTYPGRLGDVLGDTSEALGAPPAVSAAFKTAPDAATAWLAPKLGTALDASRAAAASEAEAAAAAARAKLPPGAQLARDANLKVLPSDLERIGVKNPPGKLAEKLAPSDVRRQQTLQNQPLINDMAAEDIGLPKGTHMSDEVLDAQDAPHQAVYHEVEQIAGSRPPLPEYSEALDAALARVPKFQQMLKRGDAPPSVTEILSTLRRRGAKATQSELRDTELAGYDDLAAAAQLEDALGAQLKSTGDKTALKRFQDARQAMAKINDVRQVTREGQVDIQQLFKRQENGAPLTGNLAALADIGKAFPDLRSTMTGAGKATHEGKTFPTMVRDLGTSLARKVVPRSDVLSDVVQNKIAPAAERDFKSYKQRPAEEAPPEQVEAVSPEVMDLEAPPGEVGLAPSQRETLATNIGDVLINGEPLAEPITNYSATRLGDVLALKEPKPKPKRGK